MHEHDQEPNEDVDAEATEDEQAGGGDDGRVITGWGWPTPPGEATK
jgi:hypothetical protein